MKISKIERKSVVYFFLALCVLGFWSVQADCYPFEKEYRPSWYEYGWPICFGTSNRAHFHFVSFSLLAFVFDATCSILITALAAYSVRHGVESWPRFRVADGIAVLFGAMLAWFVVVDSGLASVLADLGMRRANQGAANTIWNFRPLSQFSVLTSTIIVIAIWLAGSGIGYLVISRLFRFKG